MRQPWHHQHCPLPAGSNNEPIGPGSSVATENDPIRLVAAAIAHANPDIPAEKISERWLPAARNRVVQTAPG